MTVPGPGSLTNVLSFVRDSSKGAPLLVNACHPNQLPNRTSLLLAVIPTSWSGRTCVLVFALVGPPQHYARTVSFSSPGIGCTSLRIWNVPTHT